MATTAAAVALGLRAHQRRRLARLTHQLDTEAERIRIARDLHDELGSGLTEVSMLAAAFPGANLTVDKLHERLQRVGARTFELVSTLDEIVWAVDPRKDNLSALAKYLAAQVEQYLASSEIHCRIEMPVVLPTTPVPAETRHHLYMAVREALNNAVRHGEPRQIGFGLQFASGQLQITLWDDGSGFDPTTAVLGDGLMNLRERLSKVGGTCDVTSQPGFGTTIKLAVALPEKINLYD
jgi:signal transduction histidine kinase